MSAVRGFAIALLGLASFRFAAASDEDFRPRGEAPRLLLPPKRVRLLKREVERASPRWQAFAAVATGGRQLPEPGFVKSLYYIVTGDDAVAAQAINWAEGSSPDVRQLAIVLDWCGPVLNSEQRSRLVAKLAAILSRPVGNTASAARSYAFAALAIADDQPAVSERALREVVENWWRRETAPRLVRGDLNLKAEDEHALIELLHALNDNLRIDLREDAKSYFRILPRWHALSHKPQPIMSEDGAAFEPIYGGSPVASRAAGLALVAFDANSQESQFLQGWLMMDRTVMRSPAGAPYEFLWANPYLPGLSYHHMPSWIHDPEGGRFAMRSSWEDDADWLGTLGGPLKDARGRTYQGTEGTAKRFGTHLLVSGVPKGPVGGGDMDVDMAVFTGLDPGTHYQVQNGSDRPNDAVADRNGLLSVAPVPGSTAGIRLLHGKGKGR